MMKSVFSAVAMSACASALLLAPGHGLAQPGQSVGVLPPSINVRYVTAPIFTGFNISCRVQKVGNVYRTNTFHLKYSQSIYSAMISAQRYVRFKFTRPDGQVFSYLSADVGGELLDWSSSLQSDGEPPSAVTAFSGSFPLPAGRYTLQAYFVRRIQSGSGTPIDQKFGSTVLIDDIVIPATTGTSQGSGCRFLP